MFDQTTGRSRCFGFLTFQDPAVIDTVLSRIHVLDKKQIDPKRASQRHQNTNAFPNQSSQRNHSSPSKIFIGGLHMDATEEIISSILTERFGPVLEISLMRDRESGRFRGFGFVSFTEPRSALLACSEGSITILGRRADIKEATRRQNQQQNQQQLPLSQIHLPPTIPRTPPTTYAPPNEDLSPEDQIKQEEAWKEYYEKNPEYYYQMIKIYSDPVLLKEYLAQYYGNSVDSVSSDASTDVGVGSNNTTSVIKNSTAENTSESTNEIDDCNEKLQSSFNNRHHRQDDHHREYNSCYNVERRYRGYDDDQRRYDGHYDNGRDDKHIGRYDRNDRYNDRRSRYINDYRRNDRYRSSHSRSPSPPISHKSHKEEEKYEERRQYGGGRRVRVARY